MIPAPRRQGSDKPNTLRPDPCCTRQRHLREVQVSDESPFGPRTLAVRQFLAAIQGLTIEQWREVIGAWRTTVTDAWHDAGSAVDAAITGSERRQAREELLSQLGDITRRMRWDSGSLAGNSPQAVESTAHYVASLAALALLVRDRITR